MSNGTVSIVAAVNDEDILRRNLRLSPACDECEVLELREQASAASAYNRGIEETNGELLVFVHQDVYLPCDWLPNLREIVMSLDASWGVIGVYGIALNGDHIGRCWSSGLRRELGQSFVKPQRAASIDELVIVLRRDSGLRFDEGLPGFHLYGTDIVQTAISRGLGGYVVHNPVVHNSRPVRTLAGGYSRAYHYMQQKWKDLLPIETTIVPITKFGLPLVKHKLRDAVAARRKSSEQNSGLISNIRSGRSIALELGYE